MAGGHRDSVYRLDFLRGRGERVVNRPVGRQNPGNNVGVFLLQNGLVPKIAFRRLRDSLLTDSFLNRLSRCRHAHCSLHLLLDWSYQVSILELTREEVDFRPQARFRTFGYGTRRHSSLTQPGLREQANH